MYSRVIPKPKDDDTEDNKKSGGSTSSGEFVKVDTTGKGMSFADFKNFADRMFNGK